MKGSAIDIMFGFIFLFVIAIAVIVAFYMFTEINASDIFADSPQANASFQYAGTTATLMDTVFVVFLLAIGIGAIVSAALIPSNPAFFIIMLLINAVVWVITVPLANAYETISTTTGLATAANTFSLTNAALSNFPLIAIGLSFIVAIFMFSKGRGVEA